MIIFNRWQSDFIFSTFAAEFMKLLISHIPVLIIIIILVSCQQGKKGTLPADLVTNPNSASGEAADGLPVIEFEKDIHDFGKLIQGEVVSCNFKFKNTGKTDLLIVDVKSSCGCTVPTFPKTPIKSGEEKNLTVTFDSSGRKGIQNKMITVISNCQPNRNEIRIKAQVIEP
jgi:hypothetical protein